MNQTITAETRQRLTEIISAGLVSGLGEPRPGHLCVEAAICLAMGEPHGADPSCVAVPDKEFSIKINDAEWSSPEARAKALLPLALAQLGTAGTDRGPWTRRVVEGTIRRIVPLALRAAARVHPDEQHRAALETAAIRCEQEGTGDAAEAAAYCACAATDYAAEAAAAARVARNAANSANSAANSAAYFAAYFAADAADRDDVLRIAVQIALDAYAAEGMTP